jgi:hypothetical protein
MGLEILRQNQDTLLWVGPAQLGGRLNALVRSRRRHADVGEHEVGRVRVDGGELVASCGSLEDLPLRHPTAG